MGEEKEIVWVDLTTGRSTCTKADKFPTDLEGIKSDSRLKPRSNSLIEFVGEREYTDNGTANMRKGMFAQLQSFIPDSGLSVFYIAICNRGASETVNVYATLETLGFLLAGREAWEYHKSDDKDMYRLSGTNADGSFVQLMGKYSDISTLIFKEIEYDRFEDSAKIMLAKEGFYVEF